MNETIVHFGLSLFSVLMFASYLVWCKVRTQILTDRLMSLYRELDSVAQILKLTADPAYMAAARYRNRCIWVAKNVTIGAVVDFNRRVTTDYNYFIQSSDPRLNEVIARMRTDKAIYVLEYAEKYRISGYVWRICEWLSHLPESLHKPRAKRAWGHMLDGVLTIRSYENFMNGVCYATDPDVVLDSK